MRNFFAILIGIFLGSMVNGLIIKLNGTLIPLPAGVQLNTPEGLEAAMTQLQVQHFAVVLVAHAIGTLVASIIATWIAKPKKLFIPWIIGGLFFCGGAYMVAILNAPMLFNVIDLVVAYFPMAFLGYYIIKKATQQLR